jgi:pectate lyase
MTTITSPSFRTATLLGALLLPALATQAAAVSPLAGRIAPAAGATALVDDTLRLTFDNAPTLGTTGTVRIYRHDDNTLVDTIRAVGDVDQLGYAGMAQLRVLNNTPIHISGNTATIRPHSDKLAYGTRYDVVIDDGVLTGALGGAPFQGVDKAAGWSFTTQAARPHGSNVVVDDDGPADFRTIQGALNYMMRSVARTDASTITVKNGRYHEMLFLRGKDNLTIKGESRAGVVIDFDNNDGLNPGTGASRPAGNSVLTGGRALLLVEDADLLTLDSLTIHNTHLKNGKGDQAESIYFNSPERLVAKHVSFISRQDTVLVNGYSWFYDCLVAGDVDFIWGYASAALFEHSEIRTVGDNTDASKGGYLLQARSRNAGDRGYVFLNSRLTRDAGVPDGKTTLARSSGRPIAFDHVAFINTTMDAHIAPVGWHNKPMPNPAVATATRGWREYNSARPDGQALDVSARLAGSYQLNADEVRAAYANRAQIFSSYNNTGWYPQP